MARQRKKLLLEIEREVSYGVDPGGAGVVFLPSAVPDFTSVKRTMIADPHLTYDGRYRAPIPGTYRDAQPTFQGVPQGVASPAYGAAPAAKNAQTLLLECVCQSAAAALTTSKVLAGSTATSILEDTNDAHLPSTPEDASYTPIGCSWVRFDDGLGNYTYEPIAYTYTAETDTLTLLTELSGAPAVDDMVLGGYTGNFWQQWPGASPPVSLTIRALGADDFQNRKVMGAVLGLSIGAVSPDEIPVIAYSSKVADASADFADTRPAAPTPVTLVLAGSTMRIGIHGQTEMLCVQGRLEITVNANFVMDELPCSDTGILGYIRQEDVIEVKVTLPHDVGPSSLAGGTLDTWREAMETGSDNRIHIQAVYGQNLPGAGVQFYFPDQVLSAVDEGDVNELDVRIVSSKPRTGATVPAMVWGQG